MSRIHITGGSGTGVTTLGAALANALAAPHLDMDDFFWAPTDPPYTTKRPEAERVALLSQRLAAHPSWVLSGSALKWGEPFEPLFDLVVFLELDPTTRMERIRQREHARYGARIAPGGDMAEGSAAFLEWAAAYDTAGVEQRSRAAHDAWLGRLATPVLRLDSSRPVSALVEAVLLSLRTNA
jgi:adenylate kinase family enzyme